MVLTGGYELGVHGSQRESSGLFVHRGKLLLRGPLDQASNTASTINSTLQAKGQIVQGPDYNAPRIHSGGWGDAHLLLQQPVPSEVRIGFHEAGSSALSLYKQAGTEQLRVRGNTGLDYALAGAPGSAQQLAGYWHNTSGFSIPQAGVWTETDIRANYTSTGAVARIEWVVTLIATNVGTLIHVGLGYDGVLTWPSVTAMSAPGASYVFSLSGVVYHINPAAGAHRVSIFLHTSGIPASVWSGAYNSVWITEQRI